MIRQERRQRRWIFVLLAIAATGGGAVSLAGLIMAGMFTVSNPDQLTHWRHVAYIYLVLFGLAVVLFVVAGTALWKRRATRGRDRSTAT
jgi:MFS family permease